MKRLILIGALTLVAAGSTSAYAGFNKGKAEKFARKNDTAINCYHLFDETKQKIKRDIAKGVIIATAYSKGMNKQEAIYAIGYGVGKLTTTFEARPKQRLALTAKLAKECK
ncbi:hypothetical protein [Pseudovibrio sp. Tun.PSC04-5.I4]|uniref:hypothetical protein n=1 Tax=Pseudovibrio sp. Tun.PSC04-5.I4 TaxID=1798213 RepID=UPI000889302F|nr:hypothetical protein [Pseudovibrio sp. Tun.PSC04-5.I4]SDR05029.1 hypothetical protein SAMN04515695_2501 [Pseudovibrio sp. Tun.PSC04-5.I4]